MPEYTKEQYSEAMDDIARLRAVMLELADQVEALKSICLSCRGAGEIESNTRSTLSCQACKGDGWLHDSFPLAARLRAEAEPKP